MARICFVAHNAASLLSPEQVSAVGGLETRAWTLASGLVRYTQHQATFYTRHTRRLAVDEKDGVALARRVERFREMRHYVSECLGRDAAGRLSIDRFRWGLLWRLPLLSLTRPFREKDLPPRAVEPELAAVACDGYAAFGVGADSSRVIATARATGRPAILFLGSNADLPTPDHEHAYGESADTARYVFQHATAVIAQSQSQVDRLKRELGITALQVPSPIDIPRWRSPDGATRQYVLWIGRADDFHKRPLLCLAVARRLPDVQFRMIMNAHDPEIERRVCNELPPNVRLDRFIPFPQMPEVFASALAFLSTGSLDYEGFPNVFLQAAASETPIVTMHDFDRFVQRTGAGMVAGESVDQLSRFLRAILEGGSAAIDWRRSHEILASEHDLAQCCRRIGSLVTDLVPGEQRSAD